MKVLMLIVCLILLPVSVSPVPLLHKHYYSAQELRETTEVGPPVQVAMMPMPLGAPGLMMMPGVASGVGSVGVMSGQVGGQAAQAGQIVMGGPATR